MSEPATISRSADRLDTAGGPVPSASKKSPPEAIAIPQQEVSRRIGDGASPAAQSSACSSRVARIRLEARLSSLDRGSDGDSVPSPALCFDISPVAPILHEARLWLPSSSGGGHAENSRSNIIRVRSIEDPSR